MKFLTPLVAALVLAVPAVAQDAAQSAPSPDAAAPAPDAAPPPAPAPAPEAAPAPAMDSTAPAAPAMDNSVPAAPAAPAMDNGTPPPPAPMAASGPLPTCGPGVTDHCQQSTAAERMAAEQYKGGGRDNSAMMHGSGKSGHKAMVHRRRKAG